MKLDCEHLKEAQSSEKFQKKELKKQWENQLDLSNMTEFQAQSATTHTDARLERIQFANARRRFTDPSRALHGLRRTILPYRRRNQKRRIWLPATQLDSRVERRRVPRRMARSLRSSFKNK